MTDTMHNIFVAQGKEPADLLIKSANVVNVFSGKIDLRDVAVSNGKIIGFSVKEAREIVDADGAYLLPGLIDAHVHIESSMLSPENFARCVLVHGTTSIVVDPHELANVCGKRGLDYMLACAEMLPINIFICLPSCVPATPFEDAGATLTSEDLEPYMNSHNVCAVGEMMNVPGVLSADPEILARVILGRRYGKPVNGHAPNVLNHLLDAYMCAGIRDTHEASSVEEMNQVIERGGYVFIREGTAAKNLKDLLPAISNSAIMRRCTFCTDDAHADMILRDGHIDRILRKAIEFGLDPISAITMATLNAAEALRLQNKGGIAPGWDADMILVDNLHDFNVKNVWNSGKANVKNGKLIAEIPHIDSTYVSGTMNIATLPNDALKIRMSGKRARVIEMIPGSLITNELICEVNVDSHGYIDLSKTPELNFIAVVERHKGTGKFASGLIAGFSLKDGAIATSVAHDSHNIVVVAKNYTDMRVAIDAVADMGGGCVAVKDGKILASLPLPLAGLMTNDSPENLISQLDSIKNIAQSILGMPNGVDPLMSLSFMALPVIPRLKITARGIFDIDKNKFVDIDADKEQ